MTKNRSTELEGVELVEADAGVEDAHVATAVTRGGNRSTLRWLGGVGVGAVVVALGWFAVSTLYSWLPKDPVAFTLPHPEPAGYELTAAFDNSVTQSSSVAQSVTDGDPVVRAFGRSGAVDPWDEVVVVWTIPGGPGEMPFRLRGEIVDLGGVEGIVSGYSSQLAVLWSTDGYRYQLTSGDLDRPEFLELARAAARSRDVSIPGFRILYEGTTEDFGPVNVFTEGGPPGRAGLVYSSDSESRPDLVVSWGRGGEVLQEAATATATSVRSVSLDGRPARIADHGLLREVSWVQGPLLVRVSVVGEVDEPVLEVLAGIESISEDEFAEILEQHPEREEMLVSLPRHFADRQRTGPVLAQATLDVADQTATGEVRRIAPSRWQLELAIRGRGRRAAESSRQLGTLAEPAVARLDAPRQGGNGLTVIAGLTPPGTERVDLREPAAGTTITFTELTTFEVPGTDLVLFMVSTAAFVDDAPVFDVSLHHDGTRTRFRV